jgi:hypothetical protein
MKIELILPELRGRLWHTTRLDRFKRILTSGAILPEPDIPDADRFAPPEKDREHYPYVRYLGGVSLFDFDHFDPEVYTRDWPLSTWQEFVPCRGKWGRSVWIEIDRGQVAPKFVSASDLVERWKRDKANEHLFMPYIEAAYLGNLPVAAFRRAFLVSEEDDEFHPLALEVG